MNKKAFIKGFLKAAQAWSDSPPKPAEPLPTKTTGNVTSLGSGVAFNPLKAVAKSAPAQLNNSLPMLRFNAAPSIQPNKPMLTMNAHGGGGQGCYELSSSYLGTNGKNKDWYFGVPNHSPYTTPRPAIPSFYKNPIPMRDAGTPNPALDEDWDDAVGQDKIKAYFSNVSNKNPHSIMTEACNRNPNGCQPEQYAHLLNWVNSSKIPKTDGNMQGGFIGQLINGEADHIYTPNQYTEPPPLNLEKVIMQPPGRYSNIPFSRSSPFLSSVFANLGSSTGPLHEFDKTPGMLPTQHNAWRDNGVYHDGRSPIPELAAVGLSGALVGTSELANNLVRGVPLSQSLAGSAKALGRAVPPITAALTVGNMMGEAAEAGQTWGRGGSYLDKIQNINTNPESSYFSKVMSNNARPLGTITSVNKNIDDVISSLVDTATDIPNIARMQARLAWQQMNR